MLPASNGPFRLILQLEKTLGHSRSGPQGFPTAQRFVSLPALKQ